MKASSFTSPPIIVLVGVCLFLIETFAELMQRKFFKSHSSAYTNWNPVFKNYEVVLLNIFSLFTQIEWPE